MVLSFIQHAKMGLDTNSFPWQKTIKISNKMTMKRNPLRQNVVQLNFCLQPQKLVVMTHVLKVQLFIMLPLWLQRSV